MSRIVKIVGICIVTLYLIFLLIPVVLSPILNSYRGEFIRLISDTVGLNAKIEKLGIVTTPKLTFGVKVDYFELALPTNEVLLSVKKFNTTLSLLSLLKRRIRIDFIGANSVEANLHIKKDGDLYLEDFIMIKQTSSSDNAKVTGIPFGIKLSNNLPNFSVDNYNLAFINKNTAQKYVIKGNKLNITDFIFDKKIKFSSNGEFILDNLKQFTYDLKVFNKLMPKDNLHDLVFPSTVNLTENKSSNMPNINIMKIFESVKKTGLTSDIVVDLQTFGTVKEPLIKGFIKVDNLSLNVDNEKLKPGNILINADKKNVKFDANLYSATDEQTVINCDVTSNKDLSLNFKSNAKFNNLFKILNAFAVAFDIEDLKTLRASGGIEADFNILLNKQKVFSKGYLKIPSSSVFYDKYNIAIKNFNADIDFNNVLDIKNISLEILNQPLKIFGTIKQDTQTDIHITSDKLLIKGLVAALGQINLLRDNIFNSGWVSFNADLKGKFSSLVPNVKLSINNLNVKNKPTNTIIILPNADLTVNSIDKNVTANIAIQDFLIDNPLSKINIPELLITADDKDVTLRDTYLMFNSSKIDISGKIKNYLTKKLNINLLATGDIIASDINNLFPKDVQNLFKCSGRLPLKFSVNGDLSTQEVYLKILADNKNYYSFFDIDKLKGKSVNITSRVKIENNTAKFEETGIFIENTNVPILKLMGSIGDLLSNPKLNLNVSIPNSISINIPGFSKSHLKMFGALDISGNFSAPLINGQLNILNILIPEMLLSMNDLILKFNGPVLTGNATLKNFTFDKIVANNLSANVFLKEYNRFYINDILGSSFDGKIRGNIFYEIASGKLKVKLEGNAMNSTKAAEGVLKIKNAISGLLDFYCDVTSIGMTDVEIIKNMTGEVNFNLNDGMFLNIGRFDNLLYAQNILKNSILKTVTDSISSSSLIKETAKFEQIRGDITLSNGWANIKSIKSIGPLMTYYISGKYNMLNGTTNVVILGRLDAKIIALLGPLGDLSVDKLTSYIPKFGALTAVLVDSMTSDPAKENISLLPKLSSNSEHYKDFKVEYNGGLDSTSSIKSFKWLTKCDTSAINIKQDINNALDSVKQDLQKTKDSIKDSLENSKQQLQEAKEDLKNLFKF